MTVRERFEAYALKIKLFSEERWRELCIVAILILLIPISILFVPARGFPKGQVISIPADSTSEDIASQLAAQQVVRSAFELKALARLTGQDRALQSGIYVFAHPLGLLPVLIRLANGEHGIQEARVTLTEGMSNAEMAHAISAQIPGFDTQAFLIAASTSQGYLFPDTYFILPGSTPEDIVQRLHANFDAKIATIQPQITAFGKPLADDVIVASILEKEVKGTKDRQIVAGILYTRLKAGMALQVDAAPSTYTEPGLPPAPIANPGLDSLLAAVTPAKTNYVYYLTDKTGAVHYAQTFDQHRVNIAKYLK